MDMPVFGQGAGYLQPLAVPDYGGNPWDIQAQHDAPLAQAGVAEGQSNLQSLGSQFQAFQEQSAPYPTFPNSAGVGSQSAFGAAPQAAPQTGAQGISPWSFSGPALSR